ncbi:MAG TPA: Nramp family divalent metal transporter [Thermoplasmata archaeon]|nr:Nramp family divalent metal transporter [Thermoplasmata archaeon]
MDGVAVGEAGHPSPGLIHIWSGKHTIRTRYLAYFGPAILASVAYIDPGNIAADLDAGAGFGYLLLWAVMLTNCMAILLQYLSGKIGIATGKSLAELVHDSLQTRWKVLTYWVACECFALVTDLAEFLGVTFAIFLLSNGAISLLVAAWIGAFDVVLVFFLAGSKFRRIEIAVCTMVLGVAMGYVYEMFLAGPSWGAVARGAFIPVFSNATELVVVVAIVGATVMPHTLVLQSYLTKNKVVGMDLAERQKLLRYHRWDTIVNLGFAGAIQVGILVMAAAAFFVVTNANGGLTLNDAYYTLIPLFGFAAATIFALTLLFSGLSASTVGVLAGQALFEGLLGSKVNPWLRRIVLRVINVVPASVAILLGMSPILLLIYSQVALSLLIPLPLIPLIWYTSRKKFMGSFFVNRPYITILAVLSGVTILVLNVLLLLSAGGVNVPV